MTDKEVGELWRECRKVGWTSDAYAVPRLVHKLVDSRRAVELYLLATDLQTTFSEKDSVALKRTLELYGIEESEWNTSGQK